MLTGMSAASDSAGSRRGSKSGSCGREKDAEMIEIRVSGPTEPDSLRRWKMLREELQEVFDKWIESKSLPDLWVTWVRQMCTVGNVLQLFCAALLVSDGLIIDGSMAAQSYIEGIVLLVSLMLMLHLQVRACFMFSWFAHRLFFSPVFPFLLSICCRSPSSTRLCLFLSRTISCLYASSIFRPSPHSLPDVFLALTPSLMENKADVVLHVNRCS